jgi:hypothetical protein
MKKEVQNKKFIIKIVKKTYAEIEVEEPTMEDVQRKLDCDDYYSDIGCALYESLDEEISTRIVESKKKGGR